MKKILAVIIGSIGILLVILGIIAKTRKAFSVSIIGGADGPTSVFVAGKVGSDISAGLVIAGVALIIVVVAFGLRKMRK